MDTSERLQSARRPPSPALTVSGSIITSRRLSFYTYCIALFLSTATIQFTLTLRMGNSNIMSRMILAESESYESNGFGLRETVSNDSLLSLDSIRQQSDLLPKWMHDYIAWHRHTRQYLTPTNYTNSTKYLIMRCLRMDSKCGGASDRLKLIPFALLVAHQTKRILLIEWTRPYPLQEFLFPNRIDWTVPEWMQIPYKRQTHIYNTIHVMDKLIRVNNTATFIDMKHQSYDYGEDYFNKHAGGVLFNECYRSVWNAMFQPVPALQQRIQKQIQVLQLNHPQRPYISLHIRTLYVGNWSGRESRIHNAVHCAYQMSVNQSIPTVFITTDSVPSTRVAVDYARQFFEHVVQRTDTIDDQPLHLDRGSDFLNKHTNDYWEQHTPQDFYSVFEDLYLLAGGACHVYGLGGYGRWGELLSKHRECVYNHADRNRICPVPGSLQKTSRID